MLVRDDGTYECSLSGGCLEPSVAEAARRVMSSGEPTIVSYDLGDDSLWGLGMGCGGAIDVRIEQLDQVFADEASRAWLNALEAGQPAVLITPLEGTTGRLLVRASGDPVGHLAEAGLEGQATDEARRRLTAVIPRAGATRIGHSELFFEVVPPPPTFVVFGAGPDAGPFVRQAWLLGFSVTVVDVRTAYLTQDRFPTAMRVPAHFKDFPTAVNIPAGGFVLVMNHHLERDQESLRYALESDALYIGVLGPRSRYEKLLDGLAATGCVPSAVSLSRVRSPVGLSIGAETAEEVAVSILGEVIAVRRGFGGGFLSGSNNSLHYPERERALASS